MEELGQAAVVYFVLFLVLFAGIIGFCFPWIDIFLHERGIDLPGCSHLTWSQIFSLSKMERNKYVLVNAGYSLGIAWIPAWILAMKCRSPVYVYRWRV
jgi:hypothetical protein